MLTGKRILLGIGGGIAVYRVAELARLLVRHGATVRCVMTPAACRFVTPLTFESLTGEKVYTELFDLTAEREMGHIRLARWADAVVIAPATADLLAKIANGISDHLLTTILQVREGPVLLAPAMNASMWQSPATARNIDILRERGMHIVGPEYGELACGEEGPGRLSEPETIMAALRPLVAEPFLAGQRWVINAGPTWEPWDEVRFLSNRAGGSLGLALAEAAAAHGAEALLIAGPSVPASSAFVSRHDVTTAGEMFDVCRTLAENSDAFIATAAVGDYCFAQRLEGKLKRTEQKTLQVELVATPDIVAAVAAMEKRPRRVIAFAAETADHVEHARTKLRDKGVDAIFANDIGNMGSVDAGGWWIDHRRTEAIERRPKEQLAEALIQAIRELDA
jgi:phosphopantothenoylcysteine decarboxylase / phosphopantothenate---cysteine ligase